MTKQRNPEIQKKLPENIPGNGKPAYLAKSIKAMDRAFPGNITEFDVHLLTQSMKTNLEPFMAETAKPEDLAKGVIVACELLGEGGNGDPLEKMVKAQLLGLHNVSMHMMQKVFLHGAPPSVTAEYIKLACKASGTFAELLETLKKYKSGGEQKVTVEHVHVNDGGQAIVGTVNPGGRVGDER